MCSETVLDDFGTFKSQYAVELLHSRDAAFDQIYRDGEDLRRSMMHLAMQDDQGFYRLAEKAFDEQQAMTRSSLMAIFNQEGSERMQADLKEKNQRPKKGLHVATVHIIPSQTRVVRPLEWTSGNRVLRHPLFGNVENFCLVYFKPPAGQQYVNKSDDYRKALANGITLCGHRYLFLGASNSQLKSYNYWFYRARDWNEIEQKRAALGDFSQIRHVGKFVARLGLWFSSTSPTNIELTYVDDEQTFQQLVQQGVHCATRIDDIERHRYCFTDGCGLISKGLARLIAQRLNLCRGSERQEIYPSAYQIRVAGCKGLVIIEPQSTEEQFYLKVRRSMMKNPSDHWTLEICYGSRAISTRLNNQIIAILSDLGVPDRVFLDMQRQWFHDSNQHPINLSHLRKNKIPIPVNDCRYMFGCALSSELRPGQCFIRYELLNEPARFQTVTGPVLVTKNPCLHAGDMRRLEAIDLPELYCLRDVIVFSTEGDRPDFHQIAGSDLDGDGYFVYWGADFTCSEMVPPLSYDEHSESPNEQPITCETVIDFCYSLLGATNYGEIYNLHAVVVDRNIENHQKRTCQRLAIAMAKMFAVAIDSDKKGCSFDRRQLSPIRESLMRNGRLLYPDFLEKKPSYQSQSILGQLYRKAIAFYENNPDFYHADHRAASQNPDD